MPREIKEIKVRNQWKCSNGFVGDRPKKPVQTDLWNIKFGFPKNFEKVEQIPFLLVHKKLHFTTIFTQSGRKKLGSRVLMV